MPRATTSTSRPQASDPTRTRRSPSATTAAAEPSTEPAPAGRREALLVLSFGGPEGHDDVMPFLENVTRGRGHPARAARGRRRALPPLRRRQPDQRPEQGADRGGREGARRPPASTCPSTGATATGRPTSRTPGAQMADDGIEHVYVFATSAYASFSGLPAVPRGHRPGPRRPAGGGPDRGEAAALLRHPRLRAGQRRRAGRRARRRCPRTSADTARLVATAHSIPDAMAAVAGPRRAAPTRPSCWPPPSGSSPRSPRAGRSTSCGRAAAARRPCRGWSPTSTTTSARWRRGGETAVVVFPVGSSATTSR